MKELRNKNDWSSEFTKGETAVEWLISKNPKMAHGKSYARFEQYFGTETVREYLDSGGTKGDLRYDWEHKFLDLGDGFVEATPIENEAEIEEVNAIAIADDVMAMVDIVEATPIENEAVERIADATAPQSLSTAILENEAEIEEVNAIAIGDDVMAMVDIEESILS